MTHWHSPWTELLPFWSVGHFLPVLVRVCATSSLHDSQAWRRLLPSKTDLESGLLLSRSASDEICCKISRNFSPAGVTSPFVARAMPMAAARTSCRSAGERAGVCQPHLGPVYLRVSAACLPNFFKSRSNVSRSFFERTLATSSIAAACSPNPRLISARPLGVSSTLRTRRSSG